MKMVGKIEFCVDVAVNMPRRRGRARGDARAGDGVMRGRNRGGISRNSLPYTRGDVNGTWKHDMFERVIEMEGRALQSAVSSETTKLLVSNLDFGVSNSDIEELFSDFGPIKSAAVKYNRSGRSQGSADVIFERRADAIKAMKRYNGATLDGRKMNVRLVNSEIPCTTSVRSPSRSGGSTPRPQIVTRGGRGRRSSSRRRAPAKTPTAEELDAELEAYFEGAN